MAEGMRVVIVGGGFSGVMTAVQLTRLGQAEVVLIERPGRLAAGAAYSTREAAHFLNVRTKNMSAFPEAPDHFARWAARQGLGGPEDFVRRRDYRRYLEAMLEEARRSPRLRVIEGSAVGIGEDADSRVVRLDSGERLGCDAAVLAGGNHPSSLPSGFGFAAEDRVDDPWSEEGEVRLKALAAAGADGVLLVGTGLTMVDVCLTLVDSGYEGRMVATSRRGLVPRPHEPVGAEPAGRDPPARLGALLRETRVLAAALGWRPAVDGLRPHAISLWRGFSEEEQRRFLRHGRPWWDVHRHRIAPQVAERIAALQAQRRLEVVAGRIAGAAGGEVRIALRGGGEAVRQVAAAVNCTGPEGAIPRVADPLIRQLLASGQARADSLGIGLDVDPWSRLVDSQGKVSETLFAVGPPTRGAFWEIVAVPDIRAQVREVARLLSAY
jgi:uncharacterized NAD(P)/FAD-binding protein YdhS